MANINLLPWREEVRERKKREFFRSLFLAALLAVACIFVWNMYLNNQIDAQKRVNQYLTDDIKVLDEKAAALRKLNEDKENLLKRIEIIKKLESEGPIIVHVFDELPKLIPEGVFLTGLSREGDELTIRGVAESNNYVSNFMRYLSASDWFEEAELVNLVANKKYGEQANDFQLTVMITGPIEKLEKQQLQDKQDQAVAAKDKGNG